jgi:hypothetical protein
MTTASSAMLEAGGVKPKAVVIDIATKAKTQKRKVG